MKVAWWHLLVVWLVLHVSQGSIRASLMSNVKVAAQARSPILSRQQVQRLASYVVEASTQHHRLLLAWTAPKANTSRQLVLQARRLVSLVLLGDIQAAMVRLSLVLRANQDPPRISCQGWVAHLARCATQGSFPQSLPQLVPSAKQALPQVLSLALVRLLAKSVELENSHLLPPAPVRYAAAANTPKLLVPAHLIPVSCAQ